MAVKLHFKVEEVKQACLEAINAPKSDLRCSFMEYQENNGKPLPEEQRTPKLMLVKDAGIYFMGSVRLPKTVAYAKDAKGYDDVVYQQVESRVGRDDFTEYLDAEGMLEFINANPGMDVFVNLSETSLEVGLYG